jgi:GH15 family glucan-1,4-alpha-glucosidase
MQRIGHPQLARRFFDWAGRAQLPGGHWYQRYWIDGSAAPSWCVRADEIQLDQTCAIVHAAGRFARGMGSGSTAFVEAYRPTVERATRAILDHIDPATGLHRKATDLWENSLGAFAYTQAAVIAALREAQEVFDIEPDRTGPTARARLRDRLIHGFWQPATQRWLRRITPEGQPDPTLDSSAMGVIDPWEVLDLHRPEDRLLAAQTLDGISRDLRSQVKGGGAVLRFQGESYMGGGPGCVNTLWLALCRFRMAATAGDQHERSRQRALGMENLQIALANTSPTGQLPELIPKILFEYWAAPHAWACALLIEAVLALRALDQRELTAFDAERLRVKRRAPSH